MSDSEGFVIATNLAVISFMVKVKTLPDSGLNRSPAYAGEIWQVSPDSTAYHPQNGLL